MFEPENPPKIYPPSIVGSKEFKNSLPLPPSDFCHCSKKEGCCAFVGIIKRNKKESEKTNLIEYKFKQSIVVAEQSAQYIVSFVKKQYRDVS